MPEAAKCQCIHLQGASAPSCQHKATIKNFMAQSNSSMMFLRTSGCVKATISFATTNTLLHREEEIISHWPVL